MCGSKHSANWTTSRPSLPCSYSLLSNVLALFLHYTRPIKKKLYDVSVSGLRFSMCVCEYLCLWVHAFFLYVSGGHMSDVQSTSPESLIPFPPFPHPAFVFVQNKTYSWQRWLNMMAYLSYAPCTLHSTPYTSKSKDLVGGNNFCHHHCRMGSSNHTSSITINGLRVGIALHTVNYFIPKSLYTLHS